MHLHIRFARGLVFILFAGSLAGDVCGQEISDVHLRQPQLFDEVSDLVAEHFFDPAFDVSVWKQRATGFRGAASVADDLDEFGLVVNQLLATLKTSHTYFYARTNPKRFQLLGVFNQLFDQKRADLFIYEGIGIETEHIGDSRYVSAVYDGFPAQLAGVRFGDVIRSVNGIPFHPIDSFKNRSGDTIEFSVERNEKDLVYRIQVQRLDGRTMFERAMESSARIIESKGKKLGYIHVWSYAGQKYQDILRQHLLWGKLSQCDSLILDIRDGWGGADLNYLNLFRPPIAIVKSKSRNGDNGSYSGVWEKPVVLLTNGRSTSGKELFAYGFKKLGIGKIIGETTAGAVVAGRIFELSSGDVLYLAVNDVTVDGQRIEGIGVTPDIVVRRDITLPPQEDPQLQKAIEVLSN